MLQFSVFGFPTRVQAGFWLLAAFLHRDRWTGTGWPLLLMWMGIAFVAVLVHELGHAFVMRRYGMQPEITLHMMGGHASAPRRAVTRPQQVLISFAGPGAGFLLGGVVLLLVMAMPNVFARSVPLSLAADDFMFATFGWGVLNLLPLLPLDGGHILEAIVGPKRANLTTAISALVALVLVVWMVKGGDYYFAALIGFLAFRSLAARQAAAAAVPKPIAPVKRNLRVVPKAADEVAPELQSDLKRARAKLAEDRFDEAGTMAELILARNPSRAARVEALQIIGWAHLLEGRADEARRVLTAVAREGAEPDPGLAGATLLAVGELAAARAVTEGARAKGDHRKEVVSTLIQVLVAQDEVARAAAVALDIVESLSDEDISQMATLAFERGSYAWSTRLNVALFERSGSPDVGYNAARSRALEGDRSGSLELLRRAVEAGFSDAARAWSDKSLEVLRSGDGASELAALLPRPRTVE